mmetsp:Transcript_62150/g.165024  ORF Transcript_62150/g.165024 Transcript_62150/m.165024 type:complete len:204 (-) Transcript_62150:682-1293(-)
MHPMRNLLCARGRSRAAVPKKPIGRAAVQYGQREERPTVTRRNPAGCVPRRASHRLDHLIRTPKHANRERSCFLVVTCSGGHGLGHVHHGYDHDGLWNHVRHHRGPRTRALDHLPGLPRRQPQLDREHDHPHHVLGLAHDHLDACRALQGRLSHHCGYDLECGHHDVDDRNCFRPHPPSVWHGSPPTTPESSRTPDESCPRNA